MLRSAVMALWIPVKPVTTPEKVLLVMPIVLPQFAATARSTPRLTKFVTTAVKAPPVMPIVRHRLAGWNAQHNRGETCDDGNTSNGDGCSATCQDETADGDGDGFTVAGGDCNDADAAINPGAVDEPDAGFIDSNCDGIDGDEDRAVFVSATGSDSAAGTKASPVRTITRGLTLAGGGKDHVYISEGTYSESVNLVNGVSLWGGYSASNNWSRSLAFQANIIGIQVIPSNAVMGVRGQNIITSTTVADLHILTPNTSAVGLTNYGIYCSNCGGLVLSGNQVDAGSGGSGTGGFNGPSGANGGNGGAGAPGDDDDQNVNAPGGAGGSSSCGASGGNGGRERQGNQNGFPGLNGSGSASGGIGGSGGPSGNPGGRGQNGSSGFNGANGSNGGVSGDSYGSVIGNFWRGFDGNNGSAGNSGRGGGGGGGGGGQTGFLVNDGTGNGGGGAGGCGGVRGLGGKAGGGSFGVFLVNSTGVTLSGNTISSGNGGSRWKRRDRRSRRLGWKPWFGRHGVHQ